MNKQRLDKIRKKYEVFPIDTDIRKLLAYVEELEEALRFYANKHNYQKMSAPGEEPDRHDSLVQIDKGVSAWIALGKQVD